MSQPNPITDAIGVCKLVGLHHQNPTAVSAETVQAAATECAERLRHLPVNALELATLFAALFAITRAGWLPYVTLTGNPERPFGAVVTDEAGNVAASATGKTIEGLVELISAKLGRQQAGFGEVVQ